MPSKLRIGLLLDQKKVNLWEYQMLQRISSSDYAEISLLVFNDLETPVGHGCMKNLCSNPGLVFSKVFERFLLLVQDKLIDRRRPRPDAFERKSLETLLSEVPSVSVRPLRKKFSDLIEDEDLEKIRSAKIDLLIRMGFRVLRGGILTVARYGVWSYHHGDNTVNRGGPPGFWEMMESWPEIGSVLQILTEDLDNGKILYRSTSCTADDSLAANLNNYYWKTLSFIPRKLEELHRLGEVEFFARVDEANKHPTLYSKRFYQRPSNIEYVKLIWKKICQKLCKILQHKIFFRQWFLLFKFGDDISESMWRFHKILPPKDRFWADPHVIYRDGFYYVFIEEFVFGTEKGHISMLMVDEDGCYEPPVRILERPYHLSYPFIFESDGEIYMVPESAGNRTVELYRCIDFPEGWEFVMNLMEDVYAVDATLWHQRGKWWMFVNIRENEGASSSDELFLFYAEDFRTSNWTPHPLNPIISDVKRARPAGPLFEHNGMLYRPSQNCSLRYGYGFNINHVSELTESTYREEMIAKVVPDWDPKVIATHSFSRAGRLTMADGQIIRNRWGRS